MVQGVFQTAGKVLTACQTQWFLFSNHPDTYSFNLLSVEEHRPNSSYNEQVNYTNGVKFLPHALSSSVLGCWPTFPKIWTSCSLYFGHKLCLNEKWQETEEAQFISRLV